MLARLRRLFPAPGIPYTLFDSGVFVGILTTLWYVITEPSAPTRIALSSTLYDLYDPVAWGRALLAASVIAVAASYGPMRVIRGGYLILGCTCAFWATSLAVGVVETELRTGTLDDASLKSLGTALVYAWVVRRLLTEVRRDEDLRVTCALR